MSTEDKMNIDERRKYLRLMKKRYEQVSKKERGQLLSEMEAITELHRKSLIRLMKGSLERQVRDQQRGSSYGSAVDDALRVIAESWDYICAERLTPNLVWMAEHLDRHGELATSPLLLTQLGGISVSTVQRRLAQVRQDEPRLPRQGPKQANTLTRDVPMTRIAWDEQQPGHFEVDLVHHSGPSASGEFVCTVQMVDVATGWSERVAVLGRSYLVMENAFRRILCRLPFPVLEIHPDNGSEFFNHHMLRFWQEKVRGVALSRSRPYHKNDNRFVEQKNDTLVRAYLGHERLDTVAQTLALNHLYDQMWRYYNLFQPVMRLTEKTVIRREGQPTRLKRHYAPARTPFDRLCAANVLLPQHQQQLAALRDSTNPRQLRQEIYHLLDDLFALPNATPGIAQDVRQTLTAPSERDDPSTLAFNRTIILDN
jgi:hypothetical protein